MVRWTRTALGATVAVALVACGGGSTAVSGQEDGSVPLSPGFTPESPPAGAAVWLTCDLTQPEAPVVQVWARELGQVFGLAGHVRYDAEHLAVNEVAMATPLGADGAGEAAYLGAPRAGDVVLGGARRGPAAGAIDVTDPVLVATLTMRAVKPAQSRLTIDDLVVRRADGSLAVASTAGGSLTTAGGAP